MLRRFLIPMMTILVALMLTACGDSEVFDDEIIDDDSDPITPSLAVSDQVINSDNEIQIESVTLPDGLEGWVAIWTQEEGEPGTVFGAVAINDGRTNDLMIDLDDGTIAGTMNLFAAVHIDQTDEEDFDPSIDLIAEDTDGVPILEDFEVRLGDP